LPFSVSRERMATDPQVAVLKHGAMRLENLHFLSLRSNAQYNTSSPYGSHSLHSENSTFSMHYTM
jgi:hypothetical protein